MRSIDENVTRLSTFVAVSRASSVNRRGKRNTRATFMSNEDVEGPRIELRPALPHVPGAGAVNAAGFAYEPLSTGTIGSPVSDGRTPPFSRRFEVVLLDAPCSATGTLRKSPEIKWRLSPDDLSKFARLQRELLASCLDLTPSILLYSTCSLEAEENDHVIREVLDGYPMFRREDLTPAHAPGAADWIHQGVLRLTPESGADGFTAFMLTRKET